MTLIAAMDETGFCAFSAPQNLANRAIVPLEDTLAAIAILEAPDTNSADPDNEGRRIERVPGGWVVLNSEKYRELVTKVVIQEQTRARVRKHREKKRNGDALHVTNTALHVTREPRLALPTNPGNANVTPSEAESEAESKAESKATPPTPPMVISTITPPKPEAPPAASKLAGLEAVDLLRSVLAAKAPNMDPLDDFEASLWLRDINPDPWWLAAVICESEQSLSKAKAPAFVRKMLKNRADEGWAAEDLQGYVLHRMATPLGGFISPPT